jgi:hypothetical protein
MRPILRNYFLAEEHNEILQMYYASADTRTRRLRLTTELSLEKYVMIMENMIATDA